MGRPDANRQPTPKVTAQRISLTALYDFLADSADFPRQALPHVIYNYLTSVSLFVRDDDQLTFRSISRATRTGPKMNPAANGGSGKPNTRSSLACLPCRSRHLKCDGNRPQCGRCVQTAKQCHYPQSRRGGLDRAALAERRKRLAGERNDNNNYGPQSSYCSSLPLLPSGLSQDRWPLGSNPLASHHLSGSHDLPDLTLVTASPTEHRAVQFGSSIENDNLINAYYEYFHKLHPVVLPQIHLTRLYQDPSRQQSFKPLLAILRFIGHIYSSREWSTPLRDYVEACISQAPPTDPILVQCRLLYSISLFWFSYHAEAKREIEAGARLALDLQMFRKEFAVDHGAQDAVLTECWRRTWWMLYVVDAYYTGTLGAVTNMTMDVEATVELPCEESEYESGVEFNHCLSISQSCVVQNSSLLLPGDSCAADHPRFRSTRLGPRSRLVFVLCLPRRCRTMRGVSDIYGAKDRSQGRLTASPSGGELDCSRMVAFITKEPEASHKQDWRNRRTDVPSASSNSCVSLPFVLVEDISGTHSPVRVSSSIGHCRT